MCIHTLHTSTPTNVLHACMAAYICGICPCMDTYMHTYRHMHIHRYRQTDIQTDIHACIRYTSIKHTYISYIHTYIHTYIKQQKHTNTPACACMYEHTYRQTDGRAGGRTDGLTDRQTNTQAQVRKPNKAFQNFFSRKKSWARHVTTRSPLPRLVGGHVDRDTAARRSARDETVHD